MYDPRPFECDTIYLPSELTVLTEDISESIHDLWGRKRNCPKWKRTTTETWSSRPSV